ncbi:hypothetical protein HZH66_002105 [Vespula vulgaris]|uniref:Uncharacterized protein n=1 Tax=Vespula vulgaris TaxID=7454 RepID=A0A834NHF4_VESVU|nr:hypothetical protein HZH66_002105 [Vespula vulgaris]
MRALEGSRAAKWTSRKGPPKEEEEEEEEEVEVKEEEKEEKRSRGEHTTPYSTFYLGHPSPHPPVCRQSSSSLGLLLRGYHSAATRGATLWLPTSGPPFPRGALTLRVRVSQWYRDRKTTTLLLPTIVGNPTSSPDVLACYLRRLYFPLRYFDRE